MLLNNLESLPYNQVRESYPDVDINEIKNQDGNMDLFLAYLLNGNITDIKQLKIDYKFKSNLDKAINLKDILDLSFFQCETSIIKNKELFPPLSKKINSIQYIIFINYYINNYVVDTEIDIVANNKKLKNVLFMLLDNDKKILKLKDDSGHTVGDYLLLFLNELSIDIFEKYDKNFDSIEKTSKKYIKSLIAMTENFEPNNKESIKELNIFFNTTIDNDMFSSSMNKEIIKKICNFNSWLSACFEKEEMEKSIIKSNKKNELVKF